MLPAITLVIAFVPAFISLAFAALADAVASDDLISYGDYGFFTGSALVLFAALLAPEALCTDRRSGLLGLYLAGPLDRTRYLAAKWAAVFAVMLLITVGPLLFVLVSFLVGGYGPSVGETPELLLRILASGIVIALLYTALSMAVSSFTTRKAAAAIATVLVLIVPAAIVRPAIDSAGAPERARPAELPARRRPTSPTGSSARLPTTGAGLRALHRHRHARLRGSRPRLPRHLLAPLPAPGGRQVSAEARVSAEGVSKWFGAKVAVSEVSFEVGVGVTALLGPNGAGKSTMLRMLSGLAQPSRGTVRVLGRDPRADAGTSRSIGLMPQQESVFERLTAREFVGLMAKLQGLRQPDAEAARVLAVVELDPDDPRKLTAYSKGMRQRVKVAQAIVHDPEVLLLDEPLTGLDPRQRASMVELFRNLGERRPVRDRLEPRARGGGAARLARARHVAGEARRRRATSGSCGR